MNSIELINHFAIHIGSLLIIIVICYGTYGNTLVFFRSMQDEDYCYLPINCLFLKAVFRMVVWQNVDF